MWAEQFELEPRDVHIVREEIVSRVVSSVEDKVSQNEARRLHFAQPDSLTAWQAFHVGSSLIYRRGSTNLALAQTYFNRAVTIDPGFARAWAGLAHTYAFEVINRPFDAAKSSKRKLVEFSEKAVDANPDDPSANLWHGRALSITRSDLDPLPSINRAVELAPSYALAHQQLATTHAYCQNHKQALDHAGASLRLNPHGAERYACYSIIALALFKSGDAISSIEWSKKAGLVPYDNLHIMLAPLYTHHLLGEMDDAARIAGRIKKAFPGVTQEEIFKLDDLAGSFSNVAKSALSAHGIK